MITRVLADANILYSRTLRDWLIMLELESNSGLYKTYWTEDILAEALHRYRKNHPTVDGAAVIQIRDRIVESLEGGRVDDYSIDGSFPGTDPHDQHVHAAAIACSASYLITADQGFSSHSIDADLLPYEVHSADTFFTLVDDSVPNLVQAVTAKQEAFWERRPGSKKLNIALREAGCPVFADRVFAHLCRPPATSP